MPHQKRKAGAIEDRKAKVSHAADAKSATDNGSANQDPASAAATVVAPAPNAAPNPNANGSTATVVVAAAAPSASEAVAAATASTAGTQAIDSAAAASGDDFFAGFSPLFPLQPLTTPTFSLSAAAAVQPSPAGTADYKAGGSLLPPLPTPALYRTPNLGATGAAVAAAARLNQVLGSPAFSSPAFIADPNSIQAAALAAFEAARAAVVSAALAAAEGSASAGAGNPVVVAAAASVDGDDEFDPELARIGALVSPPPTQPPVYSETSAAASMYRMAAVADGPLSPSAGLPPPSVVANDMKTNFATYRGALLNQGSTGAAAASAAAAEALAAAAEDAAASASASATAAPPSPR